MVMVYGLLMINGCGNSQPAFTGMYVSSAASEMSISEDTLVVVLDQGNTYSIHRRTGFRLIGEDGFVGKRRYETEVWTAVYDHHTQIMTEHRNGKLISFDLDNGTMTVGRRKYKRIK